MKNEELRKYFREQGGRNYTVLKVDAYRDGGTIGIETNLEGCNYYLLTNGKTMKGDINKKEEWIEVVNPLEIKFLTKAIDRYIGFVESELSYCNELINKLSE